MLHSVSVLHSVTVLQPFYRAATYAGGDWELAYQDVRQAFLRFVDETRRQSSSELPERPLVLAGHDQGGLMVSG